MRHNLLASSPPRTVTADFLFPPRRTICRRFTKVVVSFLMRRRARFGGIVRVVRHKLIPFKAPCVCVCARVVVLTDNGHN